MYGRVSSPKCTRNHNINVVYTVSANVIQFKYLEMVTSVDVTLGRFMSYGLIKEVQSCEIWQHSVQVSLMCRCLCAFHMCVHKLEAKV